MSHLLSWSMSARFLVTIRINLRKSHRLVGQIFSITLATSWTLAAIVIKRPAIVVIHCDNQLLVFICSMSEMSPTSFVGHTMFSVFLKTALLCSALLCSLCSAHSVLRKWLFAHQPSAFHARTPELDAQPKWANAVCMHEHTGLKNFTMSPSDISIAMAPSRSMWRKVAKITLCLAYRRSR